MHSPKKAVVVVHGIGDQLQGDTLERLATSYVVNLKKGAATRNAHIRKSTLKLHSRLDTNGDPRRIDTFESDVLTVEDLPDVIFAEVYWADISRVLATGPGFFIGLVKTLTGLRFIVETAGHSLIHESKGRSARFVRQIGLYINRMLVGPLVALNAWLLIVLLATHWFGDSHVGYWIFAFAIFSVYFFFAIFALASKELLTDETKRDAIISYVIFAAILWAATSFGFLGDYIDITEYISKAFWSILSAGLFVLVIVSSLVFLGNKKARPSLTIACAGPCLNVGLWALALSNIWVVGASNYFPEVGADTRDGDLVFRLFPMLMLLWMLMISLGLVFFAVFQRRNLVAAEQSKPPGETWRLIFSPWGALLIVAFVVLWSFGTVNASGFWFSGMETPAERLREWTKSNLWLLSLFIIGCQGLAVGLSSRALDLLLDIATYFWRENPRALVRSISKSERDNVESAPTQTTFAQREKIADRFQCLVSHMVCQEGVSQLTILAHSQGTITATEQLQTIKNWLDTKIPSIRLITMGSPYTHVYQYYFPDQFKAPSLKHVVKWINIYTVDDYVGTRIDDGATVGTVPKNIEREKVAKRMNSDGVKPIGHNGYWTDEIVMQIIKDEIPLELPKP